MSLKEMTREALETEILTLRRQQAALVEQGCAELKETLDACIQEARTREKEAEEKIALLSEEINKIVGIEAKNLLTTVKQITESRLSSKWFGNKSFCLASIEDKISWGTAYHYNELRKELNKVGISV